jgi:hypothetical protein
MLYLFLQRKKKKKVRDLLRAQGAILPGSWLHLLAAQDMKQVLGIHDPIRTELAELLLDYA